LWGFAEASLAQQELDSADQLKQAIVLGWCALPQHMIDVTIGEWRRRLQYVLWINQSITHLICPQTKIKI